MAAGFLTGVVVIQMHLPHREIYLHTGVMTQGICILASLHDFGATQHFQESLQAVQQIRISSSRLKKNFYNLRRVPPVSFLFELSYISEMCILPLSLVAFSLEGMV